MKESSQRLVPSGEGCHLGCLKVQLLFEEDGEVRFGYVAEEDGKGHQVVTLH